MTEETPLIGKRLANYRVERLLAHGGMAEVYLGWDVNLQRPVAIKVIDARFRKNPAYALRFISEARAMAGWRHENIVQVYYADQQDDLYYFVMEYIDGVGLDVLLKQYLDKGEFLPYPDVLHIARAVSVALDYAHRRGVVHRDIKPPNVMISTDNRVMLMDFGLALDTQQGSMGEVFGTPHYIAPEQARRSADATPLSDVYSLGVMLYEMLTGTVPFDDPSATSVAIQHLSDPPPLPRSINPALSPQVEAVLLKVLEKDPKNRHGSTVELVQDLERALAAQKSMEMPSVELPPLPPGMAAPDKKQWHPTLAERVSLIKQQLGDANSTLMKSGLPHTSPTQPKLSRVTAGLVRRRRSRRWVWVGLAVLLVMGIGLAVLWLANRGGDGRLMANLDTPTASITAVALSATETPTATLTLTLSPPPLTVIPPTVPTDTPSHTPAPPTATLTRTPIRLMTNTPEPTETVTVTPSTTPSPTATPTPTSLTPTVLYPDGNPIRMVWNDSAFYLYNPNDFSLTVQALAFEAVTDDGAPAGYAMRGERWMLGFPVLEETKCDAVEIIDRESGYLRPEECRAYNTILTLPPQSEEIFWLRRTGVPAFRVIWQGDEVARCRIADRRCEVRLP